MPEQPPVPQPEQPPHQPSSQPSNPPTQPMPATESAQPAGPAGPPAGPVGPAAGPPFVGQVAGPPSPPAGPAPSAGWANAPKPNAWQRTTSTRGGRWGLAIAAVGVASLMIFVAAIAGVAILRNHDRVSFMGQRQDAFSRGQDGPGNDGRGPGRGNGFGNGQGPGANGKGQGPGANGNGQRNQPGMPGMPGGRAQGLGGLGNLLGGTALHGQVTATLNGSVQPLLFQRGEVTAVSDTSITLKSSDGFVGTYGRTAATASRGAAPVTGGQAFVLARASDKVAITTIATRATRATP